VKARSEAMRLRDLRALIRSDLWRCAGRSGVRPFLIYFLTHPGFKYCACMRPCAYLRQRAWLAYSAYPLAKLLLRHCKYKYGINIHETTCIGPGFFVGYFGEIVVHSRAVIGKNCNISQGVTIGETYRGERMGCPTIGDNVYIGPGAKIIGKVRVGDNVAIGANCVVTKDLPSMAVAVGIPARVVSFKGSEGYISHTDYEASG